MIIDTHTHINHEDFVGREKLYIACAYENNVQLFFNVGWDLISSKLALKQANENKKIYAILGIHPNDATLAKESDYEELKEILKSPKVVAVGEIGLDYHYEFDEETKRIQKDAFIRQINLANELNLPVSIHSRDAMKDTIDVLKMHPINKKGVFHCYGGSLESAQELMKMGFYFGVGGSVTFKNAKKLQEVIKNIPLDLILTETDSPYLTPHPYRGKQNNSSYLNLVIEKIAELKNITTEEVEKQIELNVKNLFHVE